MISSTEKDDFTKISFKPDLAKFGMDILDEDIVALLTRRVYDIAGTYMLLGHGCDTNICDSR